MADIEARREARRRKILENSEKRLQRINGVEEKSTKCELDGICLNRSYDTEAESSNRLSNNFVDTSPPKQKDAHTLRNLEPTDSVELETIFRNPRSEANDSVSNCYINISQRKSQKNLFVLVMPMVLSFVLVLFDIIGMNAKYFYLNKIFVPIIIYEVVEYISGRSMSNSPNFLTSVILLTNYRSPLFLSLIEHLQSFLNVVQDIMIYFFVFTISHWFIRVVLV